MVERFLTPFEKGNPQRAMTQNALCFGRITKVYPTDRMCEVKTFGSHAGASDNSIPRCQWLSLDGHPDGDGLGAIPRVGSFCIVAFVDNEPFVLGFFRPLSGDTTKAAVSGGDLSEDLNEGDRFLMTSAGNKITVRASGEIEIHANATCKTFYFPNQSLINTLCRNYELRSDAYVVDSLNLGKSNNTYSRFEYRKNLDRSFICVVEHGIVDSDNPEVIYKQEFGIGDDELGIKSVVRTKTVKQSGETETFIRNADAAEGIRLILKPDGNVSLNVMGKTNITVAPNGDTKIDVGPGKSTLSLTADGKLSVVTTDAVNIKATGKVLIDSAADIDIKSGGKLNLKGTKIGLNGMATGITTKSSHQGVVDLITGVPVTESQTVFGDV